MTICTVAVDVVLFMQSMIKFYSLPIFSELCVSCCVKIKIEKSELKPENQTP